MIYITNFAYPFEARWHMGILQDAPTFGAGLRVDEEMNKRREINVIHEQMRKAAENEDYETAAMLRDRIKVIGEKNEI